MYICIYKNIYMPDGKLSLVATSGFMQQQSSITSTVYLSAYLL